WPRSNRSWMASTPPERQSPSPASTRSAPSRAWNGWRCLSLSSRAPMREPEEESVPIGIPLPDLTMDQFMDLEDSWSARRDRVFSDLREEGRSVGPNLTLIISNKEKQL